VRDPSPDPVAILESLVSIPTHETELEAAKWLESHLEPVCRATGGRVSVREIAGAASGRCVLRAEWGSGPRSLIMNSHLDTVPPSDAWSADPFSPRRDGDAVVGLGAADAKGCLAAMVAAFETVARCADPAAGRLVLSAVGMEETAGLGTEREIQAGLRADAVIVGEPTDLEVCVAHKGVLRIDIATLGVAVHSSEPWAGENAISAMAPIIARLDELARSIADRREDPVGRASLAVTTIAGGTARNVVPARCEISVDRRLLPREDARAAREEIEAAVRAAARGAVEIEQALLAEAAATPASDPVVRAALEAVSRGRGVAATPRGFGACCDMRLFRNLGGMGTVVLGPGSLGQAHHADERVSAAEVRLAAAIYADIAGRWLAGGSGTGPRRT
jgi:succinyl-diaminopimelate desuccinylase